MNNGLINKKTLLLSAALLGVLGLSGCGNTSDEEKTLAVFSSSIADFKDYIQEADERINGLDVNQQESASELLEILDSMETEFAEFAELSKAQAPNQYESISRLAEQASSDMTMAVSYYHTAYESEEFDKNYADAAYQHYTYSMEAVKYIGMLLKGEDIPENDHVTVQEITNDEHILDRWLSGDKEEDAENETTASD
ncbi:MAG: hypothetical protein K1W30_10140 [Lachnospiraceae bacterium]